MSVQLPNGALIAIANGYDASKVMSALTNADPGVATLEASTSPNMHGGVST